jgi:hypothetical protein
MASGCGLSIDSEVVGMTKLLLAVAGAACAVAFTAPAQAAPAAKPGPWCGGTLWKLMNLSDTGSKSVRWSPAGTSIADIAKLAAPGRVSTSRTTQFQKQRWQVTAVVDQYRVASNGEIVLVLFDTGTSTYMDAYLSNPKCLASSARGRGEIVAARNAFGRCPAPQTGWQPLGATVELSGVGFWNPLKTTKGALPNGAELRPVTGLKVVSGCGV